MEKKIEKLERVKPMALMGMMGEVAPQWVAKELNKIIDHLNSQDQEEVKNPEYDGIREVERQKFKNIVDTVNKRYPQDTPEEKEEWEFDLRNLMYRDGEQLRCAGEGEPYTGEYRELVISMVKNLLSEREKEAVLKYILSLGWQDTDNEYVKEVLEDAEKITSDLSKLTTK